MDFETEIEDAIASIDSTSALVLLVLAQHTSQQRHLRRTTERRALYYEYHMHGFNLEHITEANARKMFRYET